MSDVHEDERESNGKQCIYECTTDKEVSILVSIVSIVMIPLTHRQELQVPKMEVLILIRLFWGVGFPLHKPYIQLI